eukprot:1098219-Pleurochrysis_carterae.AAC.1
MGVRVTVPPRTELSVPVPIATNPVTRQLAFNAMSSQLGARRPVPCLMDRLRCITSTSSFSLS